MEAVTVKCGKCSTIIEGGIDSGHRCEDVIRCPWCQLNQYLTKSGLCRKPECGKPLKPIQGLNGLHEFTPAWTPDPPIFNFREMAKAIIPSRAVTAIEKQIVPAFNTAQIVADIVSNVRPRKKKQPRYVNGYLLVPNFPTELRLRLLDYAQSKNMTMRDVVVKALQEYIDKV